jgi:peptidyl-prolyl cis-trans isomerase D
MRRHAQSWLIKFVFLIIIVVFIFWGVGSFRSRKASVLAYVNGEPIYYEEFLTIYRQVIESYRARFKDFNEDWVKRLNLKQTILDQLIERRLLLQEAKKIRLIVTDEEVWQIINQYPIFQKEGQFDQKIYELFLAKYHYTPKQFENSLKEDLIIFKLRNLVQGLVHISNTEVYETYKWLNQKINLEFIVFDPKDFKKEIKLDEKGIRKYFKEHKDSYAIAPKLKLEYVKISTHQFLKEIKLTEGEIEKYYKINENMFFEPKKVCARHILFSVPKKAPKEEVEKIKKQAEAVLAKIKGGEEFITLAKKYSKDKATAKKGGDLGCFSFGEMVKPFEKALFSLKKGEFSNLVKTDLGFHVIKVYDIKNERIKPLVEVKDQIIKLLKEEKAVEKALKQANHIYALAVLENNLNKGAKTYKEAVAETDYFNKQNWTPKLPKELGEKVLSLKKGEISAPLKVGNEFFLVQIKEEKPKIFPNFAEVEEKVKVRWLAQEVEKYAKKEAEKILNLWEKQEKIPSKYQKKIQETGFFSPQIAIPKVGFSPDVQRDLFFLTLTSPYLRYVAKINGKFHIFKLKAYQEIDKAQTKKEKEDFKKDLLTKRQLSVFHAWLNDLRQRAKIKSKKEMLE